MLACVSTVLGDVSLPLLYNYAYLIQYHRIPLLTPTLSTDIEYAIDMFTDAHSGFVRLDQEQAIQDRPPAHMMRSKMDAAEDTVGSAYILLARGSSG